MNKFIPKEYKYNKFQKRLKQKSIKEQKHLSLKLGTLGLKVLESGRISHLMLEAIRRSLLKKMQKKGKVIFFIHPNISLTKKSSGMRMGKGKGSFSLWIVPVKKGKVILELQNIPQSLGMLALKAASFKIPMKTKIVYLK